MTTQKIGERRSQTGIGSGILSKNASGKFSILALTDKVPALKGDTDTLECTVTSSDTSSQVSGMKKLEKGTFEVYHHRDNIRRFAKLEGQTLEIITYSPDMTGERFSVTVSYKVGERSNGELTKATITVTPKAYYGDVDNVLPLLQPTAMFDTDIPSMVELNITTGTYVLDIGMNPIEATFTATSEAPTIATATVTTNKLTITGVKEGSCVVSLKSTGTDMASWETAILVVVPKKTV